MKQKITQQLIIPAEYAGQRLDLAIAQLLPDYSRSLITQWIKRGDITVNGEICKPKVKLQGNEEVSLNIEISEETDWQAEALPLNIVYEDESIIVINKPAGLVVHPAAGNYSGTLVNALLHHCPTLAHLPRAGLIHRIDKDTTGLLVIAKTLAAHTNLVQQLQHRQIKREYLAIINGILTGGGTIEAPIGRHPKNRQKMAVVNNGKPAITHYRIVEKFATHTLVKVMLETGRTHQIRVHMAHIHYPIVGDPIYTRLQIPKSCGDALIDMLKSFKRQALHARRLELTHPATQKWLTWEADIPKDMQILIDCLREDNG